MKNAMLAGVLGTLLLASSAWAVPVGPGGRIYFTRELYGVGTDCQLQLYRIDVDQNWDVVADCGVIATVLNDTALAGATAYIYVASPEILHPRANADGTATGGDGSLFLHTYFDCNVHTRFWKVTPSGVTTVMHPGIGDDLYATQGQKHTLMGPVVVDVLGQASGMAGGIVGAYSVSSYGDGAWHDVNHNDDLTDASDAFYRVGYAAGAGTEAEIEGKPNDSSVQGTTWSQNYSTIRTSTYTGNGVDCHTFASDTFWSQTGLPIEQNFRYRLGYYQGSLAVGDTDGDGNTDVYAWYDTWYGHESRPDGRYGIVRMEDGTGDGKLLDNTLDMCRPIYSRDTFTIGQTTFVNDFNADADIELIKDPSTGKWSLLIFDGGVNGGGRRDGQILVMALADNGDFVADPSNLKQIVGGLPTYASAPYLRNMGIEFDADPSAAIPEPATMLLIGTGALGVLGFVRRRRMR